MPNKMDIYREILRVLRPGGALAASDWLAGENAITDESFQEYLKIANLDFIMATAEQIVQVMRDAGFECIRTTDSNAWYAALSTIEVEQIKGPLREQIVSVSDLETYNSWLSVRCALANAAKSGGLRPTHLRGYRPMVLS
jgi:SAM-dependent methyltransferase